jgi:xanthine dehydrogenase accessory factor
VLPVLPHAVALLAGATGAHPTGHATTPAPVAPAPTTEVRRPSVTVTAVKVVQGAPPCRVGSAMSIEPGGAVHGTLGCAEFDAAAVLAAAEAAASGEPGTRVFHHDLGDVEVFVDPQRPMPRAVIVSATDVARALRRLLGALGYETVLVEPRTERTSGDAAPVARPLGEVDLADVACALLTDHDAPGGVETLAALLRSKVGFIGVMGSRRHVGHYVETLRAQGFGEADLARIRSPLGLDLGGREPEEIALSIAAGVIADAHGRDGGWLDR